jgi:hypothetical protein
VPRMAPVKPFGVAMTLFELWRRLPPQQRAELVALVRRQGPRVATSLVRQHGPRVAASVARRTRPRP